MNAPPLKKNHCKGLITFLNVIFAIGALPTFYPIMLTPLILKNGAGLENTQFLLFYFAMITYPIIYLIGLVNSVIQFKKGQTFYSILFSLLPIINIITAIIGWMLLVHFCNNDMTCVRQVIF